ncbi:phosphate:Na+ symporter [Clostridium sp. USBA 49]|uniref:Na/Pi cotransporter family protein n=1 Tax=Clostridium sp. USBA 49 TaxID=1881060 RepID=UPI00099A62C0|nr:Na/Pi symporter [Clostridium sp. USBA 49]SKA86337.1 phosphate:Na+ symporter [Clostridium sp. USBA 49]
MKEFVFGIIGGTALLMYGVDMMSKGLEKASGKFMNKLLSILAGNVFTAFLCGTIFTAIVQSSTAITVLTVGFVNAGLMNLSQAVGIIFGANIGTTITAQLMAFSLEFNITDYALPAIGIGFIVTYISKNDTFKYIGQSIMGFGFMFLGLKFLNSGVPFLKESETLKYFFKNYASIPIIGIILGIVATGLVQSSSATVGLVIILGQAGLIDLTSAICIMLGDNIGTCFTAQIASLTGSKNAKRTAWAHTIYNVIGVIIVTLFLPYFVFLVKYITEYFQPNADISIQIANSHTIFNVLSAVIFLPIHKYYVKFIEWIV